jgi:ADP-ribose pyrophosphatase
VFDGTLIRVEVETWDGDRRREVVRHPGACGAVVRAGDDVVLVRQFREAVRRHVLEIPAGIYDVAGEEPEDTVLREIEEETGYLATNVEPLGRVLTSPGFTDEAIDLFLVQASPGGRVAEPAIETVAMPLHRAVEMVRRGEIQDAKSMAALLLADRRLVDRAEPG